MMEIWSHVNHKVCRDDMTQAWPKGKMIEGRSGGSGRGTRRESWAPPDSGSSTSGSYVVSCTDARPSPPTHFLPSAASSPSHLPAGYGEKFRVMCTDTRPSPPHH